jgi:hypothetical protein
MIVEYRGKINLPLCRSELAFLFFFIWNGFRSYSSTLVLVNDKHASGGKQKEKGDKITNL